MNFKIRLAFVINLFKTLLLGLGYVQVLNLSLKPVFLHLEAAPSVGEHYVPQFNM